jgi:hypothetical protein
LKETATPTRRIKGCWLVLLLFDLLKDAFYSREKGTTEQERGNTLVIGLETFLMLNTYTSIAIDPIKILLIRTILSILNVVRGLPPQS